LILKTTVKPRLPICEIY